MLKMSEDHGKQGFAQEGEHSDSERDELYRKHTLVSLRFATTSDYNANLATILALIDQAPENSIVVAPEVCLTNFDYDRFDTAADFSSKALDILLGHSNSRIIILTVIERRDNGIYNVAKVLHKGTIIHEQAKARLFKFGGEHDYFQEGSDDEIVLFEADGIRMGVLICFELRFKTLWQKLESADIIAVPSQWGKLRAQNFIVLTEALAILNQCYVVASDTSNEETAGESGIITPFGVALRNGSNSLLEVPYNNKEVKKMRRYLDVGINA